MWKLDLQIWNVTEKNDSMYTGVVEDTTNWVKESIYAINNIWLDSGKTIVENTIQTVRHPWQSIFNKWNWWKLLRSPFVIWADVLNKAKSLPFRTLDLWIQYVINNNLERLVWASKAVSTWVLANLITSNWESDWKVLNILWTVVEWAWDIAGSIIKAPTWLIGLWANKLNKYIWNIWLNKTDEWVQNLRITDKDYISKPVFQNTWYDSTSFEDVNYWLNSGSNDKVEA